ncbi:MAG: carboxypeptidase regulatory-like domain-containing protein, partial [Eubacterium sp.]|nr:carboxypeptidase regulatory-like domain-containing protein [Eubacterium sp.]
MKKVRFKALLASAMALLMLVNTAPIYVMAETEPEIWYTKSDVTIDKHILFGEDKMYTDGKSNRGFDCLVDNNTGTIFYVSTADSQVNYQNLSENGKEIMVTVHMSQPVVIDHFKIVAGADTFKANYAHRNPTGWNLKAGSGADSCNTVLIANKTIDASEGYKQNVFSFENTTAYQYYQFTITSLAGAGRSGHDSPFPNPTATCTLADIAFGGPEPINHTDHDNISFTKWKSTNSLPTTAGNYFLDKDVTISNTWNVPSGTTNLCLNGHGIKMTGNSSVMTVSAGATLKIYDCDTETEHRFSVSNKKSNGAGFATVNDSLTSGYETFTGGYITGGKGTRVNNWSRGGAFYISGAVEMYGGTVIGNGQYGTTHGGGFSTIESGTFKMYGGSIQNNAGQCGGATRLQGAVCEILGGKIINNVVSADGGGIHVGGTIPVILKDCEISSNYAENGPGAGIWMTTTGTEVSGSTVIENNLTSKGVSNIELGNGYTIAVGTLNNDAKIGIKMNNGTGVFTSGWNTYMSGKNPADYFTSDNADYVVRLKDGEAAITPPHTHSWSYSADGNVLTATCTGEGDCDVGEQTATISAESKTYDENPVTAEVTYSDGWTADNGLTIPEIEYSGNTDAGTYTASITLGTATASTEFTINEISMADEVSAENYTGDYNGEAHTISVTKPSAATVKYGTESGTYNLSEAPTFTDAGTYTVYYQVTRKNYITISDSATVTINRINAVVTISGHTTTVDYNGNAHSADGYDAETDSELYDVEKDFVYNGRPQAVRTNAGTTYMNLDSAKFENTNPNFETVEFNITDGYVEINKIDAVITKKPARKSKLVYTGSKQAIITAGSADGGTLCYAIGKDDKTEPADNQFKANIPKASEVGNYYVWYKVEADSNHISTSSECFKVTLADKDWVSVNGTVYNDKGEPQSNAEVTLMSGNKKVDSITSDKNGEYYFTVPAGIYNIVTNYDGKSQTTKIDLYKDKKQDIDMLGINTESIVKVDSDSDFGVVVDGLNEEAKSIRKADKLKDSQNLSLVMTVEAKTIENAKNSKAFNKLTTNSSFTFFDVSLEKTVDSVKTVLNSTANTIEIAVPYEKINRIDLAAYYCDGSKVKKLRESSSKEAGTFRIDKKNKIIYIYSKEFATFAIGYTPHYLVNSSVELGSFGGTADVVLTGKNGEGTYTIKNVSPD